MSALVRVGSWCAVVGGVLRIIASFIPYQSGSPALEVYYFLIDANFLIGLIAIYLAHADRLGGCGLVAFLTALVGIASIVGPDSNSDGMNLYVAGTTVFVVGLASLSVLLLGIAKLRYAAIAWILVPVLGVASQLLVYSALFEISGVILGAGFVFAGWEMLRDTPLHQSPKP